MSNGSVKYTLFIIKMFMLSLVAVYFGSSDFSVDNVILLTILFISVDWIMKL